MDRNTKWRMEDFTNMLTNIRSCITGMIIRRGDEQTDFFFRFEKSLKSP